MCNKLVFVQGKRHTIAKTLLSHIQFTYNIVAKDLPDITPELRDKYLRREDVSFTPLNWKIPFEPENKHVQQHVQVQILAFNRHFNMFLRIKTVPNRIGN